MNLPLLAAIAAAPDPAHEKCRSLAAVARSLADRIGLGGVVSRQLLKQLMTEHFGRSDATGAWSMRDAYDALEAAQVVVLSDPVSSFIDPADAPATLTALDMLSRALPTQTYRSERQIDLQQFSTPLPLAWLAAHAAHMTAADTVLEPSAGTGMLAVHARRIGARLLLNERDPSRALLLEQALSEPVSRHDAEYIDDLLPPDIRPDIVLINPPFSRSETRGRDLHAGARHLRAALLRLADRGRCVAIMPSSFAPDGSGANGYQTVAALVPPRLEVTITGRPFAKHGTGTDVRILLFDKGWSGEPNRVTVRDVRAALDPLVAAPPRLCANQHGWSAPAAVRLRGPLLPAAKAARGLFGKRPIGRLSQPAPTRPVDSEPRPLRFSVLDIPATVGEQIGLYVPWRLSRIAIADAKPHPDQLVESIAMSSILPPAPSYVPMLPSCAVAALSDAQLETVIYVGQAFERDLSHLYAPSETGTLLAPDPNGRAYRMGYFIGDGTGVGKGQQVAACILDQWCRSRRKAVWISKSSALIEDARRDWSALGGLPIDIQPLGAFPLGTPITMVSGILFVTYATLRSQRHDEASRLRQILDWLGDNFDGVITFDEAHEMANAAGTETQFGNQKGSEQGLAGVRLQNLMPRARILYVSATGATDPANLCYAIRLGLWGPGTAFDNRDAFMAAIASGGIAAMEIVARDLKALGLYTARALTFRDVEYDPLEHVLTPAQIEIYNAYADAWAIIHQNLDAVLEATNIVDRMSGASLNAQAKGSALSRFESVKQRFFGQVLIAMKMPTLIDAISHELGAGHQIIVQLVTTAEAMLDRCLAALSADDRAHLDIELSPREYMIDYLKNAFPTRMMRVFTGTDGFVRSELMTDEGGNPVHCQEALRAREDLIERLCALPAIGSALDELIRHFGTDIVAEVTGRSRRLVVDADGRQKVERRSGRSNIAEADAFMGGRKRILAFSDAGGTGRSYHADRNCPSANQRRIHFLLEPGWRASNAIQGLGRSNRTNQASAPVFRPVTTDCRGERRFISTIARRLDSLGALTRGQRQTGGQNLFDPADNLENDYAKDALRQWYHLLYRGKLGSTTLDTFVAMTGLKLTDKDSGGLLDTLPPIHRWLNRLLALRIETQNAIFEEYLALIQARIDEAREAGTLDVGVETIMTERTLLLEEQVLRRDRATGAETKLSRLELHHRRRATSFQRLMSVWSGTPEVAFLRNSRSGRVALRTPSWPIMDDEGRPVPMWQLVRPTGHDRIREHALYESHWRSIDEEAFRALWEAEAEDVANRLDIETINVATGLLLPVWNKLPDDDVRVWRISDSNGNSLLGRIISPSGFDKLAQAFGITVTIAVSPAELVSGARVGNGVAMSSLGEARLVRVYVNSEARLEIKDFPPEKREWLKSLGCFTEVISYKTRLFIPVDTAESVVARIVEPTKNSGATA